VSGKEEKMEIRYGKSVIDAISIGKIYVYDRTKNEVRRRKIDDIEAEVKRFFDARDIAVENLQELYEKSVRGIGKATASIFVIQQMLAQDDSYINAVESMIRGQKINAEYAVAKVSDSMALTFKMMDNSYMRERAADVCDLSERIITILCGGIANSIHTSEPVILLADDLDPSETLQLSKDKVISFITVNGSVNSHTAILAKTMGIPALINAEVELSRELNGKTAIIDGYHNCVYIEPNDEIMEAAVWRFDYDNKQKQILENLKGRKATSPQGKTIKLYANINSMNDIDLALANDAEGIGLFRSEFFFLSKERFPTENEQFELYKKVLEKMNGKSVTIRTIDLGADKTADYLRIPEEKNPALGLRGVRFSAARPSIMTTQLRALLRASAFGNLKILVPMITSVEEVNGILKNLQEIENSLYEKNIAVGDYKIGIMIETPSAVMISDLLAAKVDFFSIGTNDLTQYTLAVDRQNQFVEQYYNPRHIAIRRMLELVLINAKSNGIEVGVCGELATDFTMTDFFVTRGFNSLSIVPNMILPLKRQIIGI
jgi:phosphotransferase system enzyme I (PtsI)